MWRMYCAAGKLFVRVIDSELDYNWFKRLNYTFVEYDDEESEEDTVIMNGRGEQ